MELTWTLSKDEDIRKHTLATSIEDVSQTSCTCGDTAATLIHELLIYDRTVQ